MVNIVQYAYVENGILYNSLGSSIYIIGVASLTAIGAGFICNQKYRGSTDPTDRNRTDVLAFWWSILLLLSYSNLIPAVTGLPLDHIGSLVNVFIIGLCGFKYQLLDIRFVVRRGLGFTLAIIPIAALYIAGLLIMFRYLSR